MSSTSASVSSVFNGSMYVSSELNRQMVNVGQEVAIRAVEECGRIYNFDSSEAIRALGLNMIKLERTSSKRIGIVKEKKAAVKASFPMPFSGVMDGNLCWGLRQNSGLYTQCQVARKGEKSYCKSCQALADNSSDGIPEYGTIQQRCSTSPFEYVDPKGRKPVSYTKVMKKYKLTREMVLEEAGKLNIEILNEHFVAPEESVKRGRPAAKKEAKEPKGAKGRPKKMKKVLAIEGEEEDLFASLVADACEEKVEAEVEAVVAVEVAVEVEAKKAQEKEAKKVLAAQEKEAKIAQEKAEKEAKKVAEEQAKALKLKEKEEKEALKLKEKEEKEALKLKEKEEKEALKLKEKAEKEALKLKQKEEKPKKAPEVKAASKEEDDEEPDVVKKIEIDGKKYLKSKKTGIIYDYLEYTKNSEQVVVGKWNETKNKIDFAESTAEESEEEYDEEDA